MTGSRQIIVAGAGIAGLTAALAFAQRGFPVRVFERASRLEEVGAGLQLSPNATRILDRLGVLPALMPVAVRPKAVVLRSAADLRELTRIPLGVSADKRWGSPYLVIHRADLHSALLARISKEPEIELVTAATVGDMAGHAGGVTVSVDVDGKIREFGARLLVGADGVWSTLRRLTGGVSASRFTGEVAWRSTLRADGPAGQAFARFAERDCVNAFLHPGFHLIAYPIRAGAAVNVVAFSRGAAPLREGFGTTTDAAPLQAVMRGTAPELSRLVEAGQPWTCWPIHVVEQGSRWVAGSGLALIGDAAHAMTPFAAQGAAMAIEDAESLADAVVSTDDTGAALASWEALRTRRVERVARRGAFNRFAWHASGPVRIARDLALRMRPPEKLAADLDWLYAWDAAKP